MNSDILKILMACPHQSLLKSRMLQSRVHGATAACTVRLCSKRLCGHALTTLTTTAHIGPAANRECKRQQGIDGKASR